MRAILLIIGWVLTIGAAANAAFAGWALVLIGQGGFTDWGMSVDAMIADHAQFLAWVKPFANSFLPAHFVEWMFATPALVVFPLRAIIAGLLGMWALKAARR
ncbi:MAG: hypothetical protein R3C60_03425 [Parvularculaceae bacterium]